MTKILIDFKVFFHKNRKNIKFAMTIRKKMTDIGQIPNDSRLHGKRSSEDADIFKVIWTQYSGKVYNFISSMIFDKSSAEDLTQEVFLKIWEKREEIDLNDNYEGYIFTIARNLVYKETRKMLTNASYVEFTRQNTEEADESTQNAIDASSMREHLISIVNQMPPARKNIYILNKVHGLPVKDIAERLGLSVRTVENQLYQATIFIKSKFPMSILAVVWIYLTYGQI